MHKQCIIERKSQIWDWVEGKCASNGQVDVQVRNGNETLSHHFTGCFIHYRIDHSLCPFPLPEASIFVFPGIQNFGFAKSVPLYAPLPVPTAIGSPYHFFHPFHAMGLAYCNVLPLRTYVNYSQNYDLRNSCSSPVIATLPGLALSPMYNYEANIHGTSVLLSITVRCYHALTVNLW